MKIKWKPNQTLNKSPSEKVHTRSINIQNRGRKGVLEEDEEPETDQTREELEEEDTNVELIKGGAREPNQVR